ncbi:hypothetical protein C8J56DRAFT_883327 [Mycena floridula]|nr:hypothetical protein C8J56DRAFT_883327 [Mycena floridula]
MAGSRKQSSTETAGNFIALVCTGNRRENLAKEFGDCCAAAKYLWWRMKLESRGGRKQSYNMTEGRKEGRTAVIRKPQYNSVTPGEKYFHHDTQARSIEETNLQAILLKTSKSNLQVNEALYTLAGHVQRLFNMHQFQESLQQHRLAREAYPAVSESALAAWTFIEVADVSSHIDPSFNKISLLQQAQQELESINEDDGQYRKMMACCLIRLGNVHSLLNNHSEALEHLTKAKILCSDLHFETAWCAEHLPVTHHCLLQLNEAENWDMLVVNEWKEMGAYLGRSFEALENYGNLEGVDRKKIACQYYLNQLDDPSRVTTSEEKSALMITGHGEDISGDQSVATSTA